MICSDVKPGEDGETQCVAGANITFEHWHDEQDETTRVEQGKYFRYHIRMHIRQHGLVFFAGVPDGVHIQEKT